MGPEPRLPQCFAAAERKTWTCGRHWSIGGAKLPVALGGSIYEPGQERSSLDLAKLGRILIPDFEGKGQYFSDGPRQ